MSDFNEQLVRVYDFATREVRNVSASEIQPGMVMVHVHGIDGEVWVDAAALKPADYKHPPFDDMRKKQIAKIYETFCEIDDKSREEWEDGFRRDANPDKEIAIWLRLCALYQSAVSPGEKCANSKREIFSILVSCTFAPRDEVLKITRQSFLSRKEAEEIVGLYYDDAK